MTDETTPAIEVDYTDEALSRIETQRRKEAEPALEAQLSINDWIKRASNCARIAHGCTRAGQVEAEIQTWVDMASVAVGRIEHLIAVRDRPIDPDLDKWITPPSPNGEEPPAVESFS